MHIYMEIKASIPINENTTHPAERISILLNNIHIAVPFAYSRHA